MTADERVCSPVSDAELERRWSAARAAMRVAEVDALLLQGFSDLSGGGYFRWLTGQQTGSLYPRSLIFPLEGPMTVVENGPKGGRVRVDGRDPVMRGIGTRVFTTSAPNIDYTAHYDADLAAAEIRSLGCRRLGLVNAAAMYHGFRARIGERLKDVGVVDVTESLDCLKAIKSDEEMAIIRRTAAMQDAIMAQMREHIRPGMRDYEVFAHAQFLGLEQGSEGGIFLGSSAPAGKPAVFRPRSQQGRALEKGDTFTLLVENSGQGGYYTELSRTFVLGAASQELRDAHAAAVEAQQQTVNRLKPGARCSDIFAAHNEHMRSRGLPEERRLYGHSQGYDVAERPLLRDDETLSLTAGMNMAVHPTIASERLFITVTDNFFLGPNGAERLHRTARDIIELT
jgi:Xaa-Pro aminopeptidase